MLLLSATDASGNERARLGAILHEYPGSTVVLDSFCGRNVLSIFRDRRVGLQGEEADRVAGAVDHRGDLPSYSLHRDVKNLTGP